MSNHNILITQAPFSANSNKALDLLKKYSLKYYMNPYGRVMTEEEMMKIAPDYDIILSGTSPISKNVIKHFSKLQFISRAGIGIDNIDLNYAKEREIKVCYTPSGPTDAVAEFTIGLIINCLRGITIIDEKVKNGIWEKFVGRNINETTIGIIGVNRIGKKLIELLTPFSPNILAHDIKPDTNYKPSLNFEWTTKENILKVSDIVTLHIPLTNKTKNYISKNELKQMKDNSILINTSRGGILNEDSLIIELDLGRFKCVALDVFKNEPYNGRLLSYPNVVLTSHMASATYGAIENMEVQAVKEILRFINNEPLMNKV